MRVTVLAWLPILLMLRAHPCSAEADPSEIRRLARYAVPVGWSELLGTFSIQ